MIQQRHIQRIITLIGARHIQPLRLGKRVEAQAEELNKTLLPRGQHLGLLAVVHLEQQQHRTPHIGQRQNRQLHLILLQRRTLHIGLLAVVQQQVTQLQPLLIHHN
jgi:hypothetical protein